MAFWVMNSYKDTFVIMWDGTEYIINPGGDNLLPDDAVKAYFPSYDDLKVFLPRDINSALLAMRSMVDVFLSRWGPQITKYYKLSGNVETDINNFFDFLSGFKISEKRFTAAETE